MYHVGFYPGTFLGSMGTPENRLLVSPVKRSTIGSRAFPVADPRDTLPEDVTSSQSEYAFRGQLKTTWLFNNSLFFFVCSNLETVMPFKVYEILI